MNGARTIFRRKGYFFTALAAAVLLAASSGTALAQVTVTAPETVNEGDTATLNVSVKGYVAVAPDADTPGGGGTATFTAVVPAADIAVPTTAGFEMVTSGDAGDISANQQNNSVTFNIPENTSLTSRMAFSVTGTVSVVTTQDDDAEDEYFIWGNYSFNGTDNEGALTSDDPADGDQATVLAATDSPDSFIINDDETQTYVLALNSTSPKPAEGASVTVDLTAMPEHDEGEVSLTVAIDKPLSAYTFTGHTENEVTIGGTPQNSTATLRVMQDSPDGNRTSDTVTLTAHSGRAGSSNLEDSLAITMADLHALPAVTAMVVGEDGEALDPQPESVTEGESVMIKVMVLDDDGKPDTAREALKVELSPSGSADARDYRLSKQTLEIASGTGESDAVTLMAEPDEDVGMETLVLSATVSGDPDNGTETSTSDGILSLDIGDATDKIIEPKTTDADYDGIKAKIADGAGEDGLNPGETVTLMTSDLFDVMTGYSASYGASSNSEAVGVSTSGDTVTITANMAGDAEVTITGTATMGSSSLEPSQTVSNVASVKFPVTVVDTELVVTVSADPMEIAEGGTSMITATANRYVTAGDDGVEIALTVVGDGELDADSIMIAIGDMSGSVMLTAAEDDDYADGSVTVVATGDGIDGTTQVTIAVTDKDEEPVVVEPEPENTITPNSPDDAYPIITGAIEAGAGAEGLNPGESFSVDASALFTVMDGYSATYSAVVDGDSASASVSGSTVMVSADAVGDSTVTVTGTGTMSASSLEGGQPATNVATQTFPVSVVHRDLVVTVAASASDVDEGDSVTLTATANRPVDAAVALDVTATGDSAAVSVGELSIAAGATEGTADVMAVEDDDTANAEVTLVVSGDGIDTPISIALSVTDNDPTVTALEPASVDALFNAAVSTAAGGDMWAPGGNDATVDMSSLFSIEDGATVEYEASSSAEDAVAASASGSSLSLSPAGTGSSTIMVTATDTSGDAYDTATVSSMVTVGVLPLVVTLEMPANVMNGNIVEGESYDIGVSANRVVTEDTVVMIMRDRAASDAGGDDYSVSEATIMAGYDSATATLMVTEDNEPDSGTNDNMGESLVLYGMAGDMETNSLTFTIWDQAVPSLPLLGQLLLALFLMLGGARLYRRRQG